MLRNNTEIIKLFLSGLRKPPADDDLEASKVEKLVRGMSIVFEVTRGDPAPAPSNIRQMTASTFKILYFPAKDSWTGREVDGSITYCHAPY